MHLLLDKAKAHYISQIKEAFYNIGCKGLL